VLLETKPTAVVLPLAIAVVKQPLRTQRGLGGSELKCMNQVIVAESQAAFIKGTNAENPPRVSTAVCSRCGHPLKQLQASPLCGNAIPSKQQTRREVCGSYPATVIHSCLLKASCSRCDDINIKMIKLQTTCHPCMHQFLLDFVHLSWKCIELKGRMHC